MKFRAFLGSLVLAAAVGALLPAGVRAEPPIGAPPVTGLATGLYYRAGAGSWYDTLLGNQVLTDNQGRWGVPVGGVPSQPYWVVIDATTADPTEVIHGDLWQLGTNKGYMNGVTATLWADRNLDGRFGPVSADGAWLDQDTTHCTGAHPRCGDYVLGGSDGNYPRGITLEVGVPASGVTSFGGWVWNELE